MSLEQVSTAVKFLAHFVASKQGATGLTVTVDVYNPAGTLIVTAGAATEIGGGLYSYTLAAGSTGTEGEYVAIFKTASSTVDQQHIPSLWVVGRAGIENLNATIGSRASQTSVDTIDDFVDTEVAAIKAKTDLIPASPAAVGSAMTLDLAQALSTGQTGDTVGGALLAARAQGFGRWVLSGTTLTLYAADGSTVVRSFTLDSATTPTSRT